MKFIDLTIPLGIATPPWPTYEPLQVKYFKRLAPNGANGQVVTHSNHLGTHLDGEIHFHTPGKDIASLEMDYLVHDAAVVDLSDVCGDYDVYTSKMVEERVEVREGDILIIHTGYHHFGWDMPTANEIRYMVMHPGPDREFADWAKAKKLRWIGVDCGSADHPMNTIIRDWMPRQARQAEKVFKKKYGMGAGRVLRRQQVPADAPGDVPLRHRPRRVHRRRHRPAGQPPGDRGLLPLALCGWRVLHRALRRHGGR